VEFTVSSDADTFIGTDIKVTLTAKNVSDAARTINGTLTIGTTYYTGVFHRSLLNEPIRKWSLAPKEGNIKVLNISNSSVVCFLMTYTYVVEEMKIISTVL